MLVDFDGWANGDGVEACTGAGSGMGSLWPSPNNRRASFSSFDSSDGNNDNDSRYGIVLIIGGARGWIKISRSWRVSCKCL